jgi:uncharacterized protein (TIGR03118 family)
MYFQRLFSSGVISAALWTVCTAVQAATFSIHPLVSDNPVAVPAPVTDARLVNAWGLSYAPGGPFWLSATDSGVSTVYKVNPNTQATSVSPIYATIPGDGSATGQVYLSAGREFKRNIFFFVSEDGTVSGWRPALGSVAEVIVPASADAVYKGVAGAVLGGHAYLYAANFRSGAIDVIRSNRRVPRPTGDFSDPTLPAGYAPFNVQRLGDALYVSYAVQDVDKKDEVAGPGLGIVNRFDLQGQLLGRVVTGGALNAPWGLAVAPSSFGPWAGALLVGNFGDGRINAYDATTNAWLGTVNGGDGQPLVIDGLWALSPGGGGQGGSTSLLYFTAGPNGETHGLFGVLTPNP